MSQRICYISLSWSAEIEGCCNEGQGEMMSRLSTLFLAIFNRNYGYQLKAVQ